MPIRVHPLTSVLLCLCGVHCHAQSAPTSKSAPASASQRTTILPISEGQALFGTHHEQRGKDRVTFWIPTPKDVQQLETDLPMLARMAGARSLNNHWPSEVDVTTYDRQYLGIVQGGRPLIYLNAFAPSTLLPMTGGSRDWRTHAVFVSDGGYAFFHATYDPKQHRFTDFSFNGFA